ncbi:hypothetical protein CDAR_557821 [Caerostris darwini]|uniref:Uncharacterized protein n=1 Tax=Caerostris darwini TaxID=1538125 RepID=A0AAV4R9B4_9ARAC|nr:hypothetical protein CDAR_557821 [Caerostris darwini]
MTDFKIYRSTTCILETSRFRVCSAQLITFRMVPHLQQYERSKTKSVPLTNHPPEQKEGQLKRAAPYLCTVHTNTKPSAPPLIRGDKTLRLRIVKREKFITRSQLHDPL